jgi:hypothetical protein
MSQDVNMDSAEEGSFTQTKTQSQEIRIQPLNLNQAAEDTLRDPHGSPGLQAAPVGIVQGASGQRCRNSTASSDFQAVPVESEQEVHPGQALLTSMYHLLKSAQIGFTAVIEQGKCSDLTVHWKGFPEVTFSVKPENNHYPKVMQLPAPKNREPVLTGNNQLITKTYSRRRFKIKRGPKPVTADPIFGIPQEHQLTDRQSASAKRLPTPASENSLRRSKRRAMINGGYKPQGLNKGKPKALGRKPTAVLGGKALCFVIPQIEFPDLAEIDKWISKGLAYPHIPTHELQKVAVQACGILAEEVAGQQGLNAGVMEPGKEQDQL